MDTVIIICTVAYNAEKTLNRTISSVLSQTYKNLVYYLVDNGSTDRTSEIIRGYAKMDSRIVPHFNKKNHEWEPGSHWQDFARKYDDSGFYCSLDADDEYKPEALEKMLYFAQSNRIDVVACGSDFIDAKTNRLIGGRMLQTSMVISELGFSEYFPIYHQYIRTFWGKLISLHILRKSNLESAKKMTYGSDTAFMLEILSHPGTMGVLQGTLHKYYISSESCSYVMDNIRLESGCVLDDLSRGYLIKKCGFITKRNDVFLNYVYLNAIADTLKVLTGARVSMMEKMNDIETMVFHPKTGLLFACIDERGSEMNKKIREPLVKWLTVQKECRRLEGARIAARIIFTMYPDLPEVVEPDSMEYLIMKMPEIITSFLAKDYNRVLERIKIWYKRHNPDVPSLAKFEIVLYDVLNKAEEECFSLLVAIKTERPASSAEICADMPMRRLLSRNPLLADLSIRLATDFSRTVYFIFKKDYLKALEEFIRTSEKIEIDDQDADVCFLLGQNLAAAAGDTGAYIYFKKIWISYLIDVSRDHEAETEIDELQRLVPDDADFTELRHRLFH